MYRQHHGVFRELKAILHHCILTYMCRMARHSAEEVDECEITVGYEVKPRTLDFILLVIKHHPSV